MLAFLFIFTVFAICRFCKHIPGLWFVFLYAFIALRFWRDYITFSVHTFRDHDSILIINAPRLTTWPSGPRLRIKQARLCARYKFAKAKAREYVLLTLVCLSVCVCLSVIIITKKIVDEFVPHFMERFLGGKVRPSSCFVTIGRGMWK